MKDIFKQIKENVGAIITAIVVFILVSNYLLISIPANEARTDQYNKLRLDEFSKQLNSTLNDYANKVDAEDFKCKTKCFFKTDTIDINTHIIIDTIEVYAFENSANYFYIKRIIRFKFSDANARKLSTGDTIVDDIVRIPKNELTNRLSGSTSLPFWLIYEENQAKDKNGKYKIPDNYISKKIDLLQSDSIYGLSDFNKLNKTSVKRYYKTILQPFNVSGKLVIIGAIDTSEFIKQARKTNVSNTILSVVLVILLFLIIPLIKPLISSTKEKLTQFDLVSTTTSICICTVLITISIFMYYFYSTQTEAVKGNLSELNNKISNNLTNELKKFKNGNDFIFKALDSKNIKQPHTDSWRLTKKLLIEKNKKYAYASIEKHLDETVLQKEIAKYINAKDIRFPEINFEMDRFANMQRDVTKNSKFSIRKNYRDRDYIAKIKLYDTVLSAVYSKYDNKFKLVYISDKGENFRGFVYHPSMYKLPNDLDKNYGYIVCDKEGNVLLHSDSSKWLNENIYTISNKSPGILEMLHGIERSFFEVDYDGKQCIFYGQKFNYDQIKGSNNAPLYLITYKNISFENDLNIHGLVTAFIISLSFGVGLALILLCYSVFLYFGHLSIFSKTHIYWLFPDRSKRAELNFLTWVNYSFCGLLAIFLIAWPDHALFLTFITTINAAFFNFVVLTQRAFQIGKGSKKRRKYLIYFISSIISGITVSIILYHKNYQNMALSVSLLSHFWFLWKLKGEANTELILENDKKKKKEKFNYNACLTSAVCLFFVLVPAIIVFSVFGNERCRLDDINHSVYHAQKKSNENNECIEQKNNYSEEWLFNQLQITVPPSKHLLEQTDFDNYVQNSSMRKELSDLFFSKNAIKILCLVFGLLILVVIICLIGIFYTGRFFFFELSIISRKNYANKHRLANVRFIIPPFSANDLELLEDIEIGKENVPENYFFPSKINDTVPHKKLELILSKALAVNKREYIKIWNSLNADEKFVMYDFAVDYFVNYKNKKYLVDLIQKGLIIADSITGRLRVMNYSFRNFVIYYEKIDPNFSAEEEEKRIKGTFSKWKLPLIIIAISGLILLMYLYKEKYDQVLLYGGSILSTVALIARFLNTYKK